MRSSPSHSGVLSRTGFTGTSTTGTSRVGGGMYNSDTSSMEELQSAIQGAIAHCKNSMIQNKTMSSGDPQAAIKQQDQITHQLNNDIKQQQQRSFNSNPLKDSATDSPIFHNSNHNNNDTYFFAGDDAFASQPVSEIYADEAIDEDVDGGFLGSDSLISPSLMEMELEEGFALREGRRRLD
ncbi:hypothetical protein CMV_019954 [Castanea mollissima]|uniref:Uncharacterized protein n=1 Tax=Castanea mollissima TaxID=60419 RepID=A0A8J4VG73_9ROSI|nr:hypothetical protein CMV_019954 [Castanea mollissima]